MARLMTWALKGVFIASTPVLAALQVDLDDEGMFAVPSQSRGRIVALTSADPYSLHQTSGFASRRGLVVFLRRRPAWNDAWYLARTSARW